MAAGRHGGYRDNEFRGREADTEVSRREIEYSKGVYDRNRVPIQDRSNGDDGSRIRRRDTNGREVMNGGYKSSSRSRSRSNSRSDSGSSGGGNGVRRGGGGGGSRIRDYIVSGVDREPGELSSESSESDEAIESDTQVKKSENGFDQSKKRKYSPIIWDREEKEANMKLKSRNSPSFTNLPPPPPLPKPHTKITSPEKLNSLVSESTELPTESPVRLIPSEEALLSNNHGEDEDFAPTRNIKSSRWANEGDSSPDEGEISQDEELKKKKSLTPELKARSRSKSTESEECVMEIDTNSNASENKSYTDSENEHNSSPEPIQVPQMVPQRRVNMLQGCRSVEEFERLNKIDEGTYGVVFRAKDTKSGEIVALKKVKMEKEREGFPMTSLREINILLSFHHPSIIDVKEVVVGSSLDSIFMVMEYMEHDLKGLMETMKQPYSQSEVKCLMLQLLEGVKYLHDNWVLHRDLKTSNLLLNNCGELKICDFGLARQYGSPLKPYTHLVVTLWYRAPELLLGTKLYSTAIDMWSLGCIMAELLSKKPLFNGRAEVDQLDKIFKTLGTPNETIWPGFTKLPGVKVNFAKHPYNQLRKLFPPTSFTGAPVLSDSGFDLLNKLLTYDPERRISAEDALNHEWFREVPLPKSKEFMPTFPAQHAQDRRTRRVMKSPDPLEEQRLKELQGGLGTGGVFG